MNRQLQKSDSDYKNMGQRDNFSPNDLKKINAMYCKKW